ncbi:low temperature requirement protein A [Streptomyces sp. NBC_01275]|uniref:low temperature requirement protein A n=1 Tax=Streptomyces sp. NBC_01275 TaxID=2903807 RepID=UPI00224F76AB|nr:low temperature requirement protein A [Streptomyces sp. NBC_01275]MCX4761848.1 low temperature requirement protein A [Streptomyces sp. NBC_01275]
MFFDLVYVFAIGQLSHRLLVHPTWTGAAPALVLYLAVYAAWAYTTWAVTLVPAENPRTRRMLLGVMLAGLFMNAAIPRAFGDAGTAVERIIGHTGPFSVRAVSAQRTPAPQAPLPSDRAPRRCGRTRSAVPYGSYVLGTQGFGGVCWPPSAGPLSGRPGRFRRSKACSGGAGGTRTHGRRIMSPLRISAALADQCSFLTFSQVRRADPCQPCVVFVDVFLSLWPLNGPWRSMSWTPTTAAASSTQFSRGDRTLAQRIPLPTR